MSLKTDIQDAVGGAFCSLFNSYDRVNRLLAGVLYPERVDEVLPLSPAGKIANGGQALFCDRGTFLPPATWPNGQCPQGYRVFSGTNIDGTTTGQGPQTVQANTDSPITGPVQGLRPVQQSNGRTFFYFTGPNIPFNGQLAYQINPIYVNPQPFVVLTPEPGNPDNCGAPPPPEPLPVGDRTTNITVNNNTGPVVFLPPIINVNGDLSIPFQLDIGELEFSGTLELNTGDITLNFGGQPTDPDAPIVPTPDGDPPPADNDDPDNDKPANIIGVIVVATQINDFASTQIPQTNMPDLFIPRLADVSFKIRIKASSHWTSDLPVKSKNAYIPCPGDIDAIDVVVAAQKGWSVSATPVRGIVPSNQVVLV